MKKLLFAMILFASVAMPREAEAQRATLMPLVTGDTITNTGTVTKVITLTDGYAGVVVQTVLTKLSGTGAGTVGVWGSLDGTNYLQIGSNQTITDVATQNKVFYVSEPVPVYLKVLATGSGTESVGMRTYYVVRKHN